MSNVRLLIGTKKGAFILTSDEKREQWDISGPHFAGWEMYPLKGSPADPTAISCKKTPGCSSKKCSTMYTFTRITFFCPSWIALPA